MQTGWKREEPLQAVASPSARSVATAPTIGGCAVLLGLRLATCCPLPLLCSAMCEIFSCWTGSMTARATSHNTAACSPQTEGLAACRRAQKDGCMQSRKASPVSANACME